jgi:hypothetical protein
VQITPIKLALLSPLKIPTFYRYPKRLLKDSWGRPAQIQTVLLYGF